MAAKLLKVLFLCVVSFLCCCSLAWGGEVCVAGPVSGLIGTTCDIGVVEFTFTQFNDQAVNMPSWSASDFSFIPLSNGFTLTFDGGPQTTVGKAAPPPWNPSYLDVGETAGLDFTFQVTNPGLQIGSLGIAGGALSMGTHPWSSLFGEDIAEYSWDMLSTSWPSSGLWVWDECILPNYCPTYTAGSHFPPLTSGIGSAVPLELWSVADGVAAYGGASWDGAPTNFTFSTATVPEPGTMLLFSTMMLGFSPFLRVKR